MIKKFSYSLGLFFLLSLSFQTLGHAQPGITEPVRPDDAQMTPPVPWEEDAIPDEDSVRGPDNQSTPAENPEAQPQEQKSAPENLNQEIKGSAQSRGGCDLDHNGRCDQRDQGIFFAIMNKNFANLKTIAQADTNDDGYVDEKDGAILFPELKQIWQTLAEASAKRLRPQKGGADTSEAEVTTNPNQNSTENFKKSPESTQLYDQSPVHFAIASSSLEYKSNFDESGNLKPTVISLKLQLENFSQQAWSSDLSQVELEVEGDAGKKTQVFSITPIQINPREKIERTIDCGPFLVEVAGIHTKGGTLHVKAKIKLASRSKTLTLESNTIQIKIFVPEG